MSANDPHHHLSRRQRQIMDTLYALGEADVADVQAQLPNPPGYSAVRAMLARLEKAGHIGHKSNGAKYVYFAIHAKDNASQSALKRLVSTFFGGSGIGAATALLDEHANEMTDKELDELEQQIKKARQRR